MKYRTAIIDAMRMASVFVYPSMAKG
jgi:hypothetical protein